MSAGVFTAPEISSPAVVPKRVLILGYGNPGREDDGLGPAAADEMRRMNWPNVTVRDSYQLVIEDCVDVVEADVVWFIDSAKTGREPYEFSRISYSEEITFTTHLVKPEAVLALAKGYYGKAPEAYLLGIRGYRFEFAQGFSERAQRNLQQALMLLKQKIRHDEDTKNEHRVR